MKVGSFVLKQNTNFLYCMSRDAVLFID